ncbi:MAG: hypothetical protein ACJ79R_04465, partial [Anaeromyxobacteraceae bacterium]
ASHPAAAEGLRDVHFEQGDLAAAVGVQRRIRTAPPDAILAHLLAALARAELPRDPARAREIARTALGACPRSADALLALAEAEAAAGRTRDVAEAVAAALDEDASCALLAWPALAGAGDLAAALAVVDARLARSPGDAALHFLRGRLLQAGGGLRAALPALWRALECDTTGEVTLALRDLLRDAEAPAADELAARHDLMRAALLHKARPMRCTRCGVEAALRPWRCSRCGAFESFALAPPPP